MNGTVDYKIGEMKEAINHMKKDIDVLCEIQKSQQSTIDKAIGGLSFIKWGFGLLGIAQIFTIITNLIGG